MKYYERMEPGEDLGWCSCESFDDGSVIIANNEGNIVGAMVDGVDVSLMEPAELLKKLAQRCNSEYDEYEGWDDKHILYEAPHESLGCARCPWRDVCDAMDVDDENEGDDEEEDADEDDEADLIVVHEDVNMYGGSHVTNYDEAKEAPELGKDIIVHRNSYDGQRYHYSKYRVSNLRMKDDGTIVGVICHNGMPWEATSELCRYALTGEI